MSETFLHGVQVLEVDTGTRPIRTVRSSVIGLVGTGNSTGAAASVTIGTGNASLKFVALAAGVAGNQYRIQVLNDSPSLPNLALAITRNGNSVTISNATNSSGNIVPITAAALRTAFNAASSVNTILRADLPPLTNGSSDYVAHAFTFLAGGIEDPFPLDTPVLVTSPTNVDAQLGAGTYLGKSLEAIYKQAGAVVVVVRTTDVAGDATDLTGVYALKRAQSVLGYVPRIIVAEGASAATIEDVKSVCDSCRAIAVVGIDVNSATDATQWMDDNANERVYGLWPYVNGYEDPAPYVAGVIAKSDNDRGFWWSPSNQEVFGITSLDSPVDFQLGDSTSLANILNEGKVTTFIRQGGFRVWGNLTGSIDAKWQFLSVRRTADIINDSILANHLWAVDRNITRTYLEDVSDGVNNYLSTLTNLGAIIGGKCWPDPDLNSPDQIALGKVYFNFEFTPPYPAQTVTFRSILTNDYLSELID
jgi:phage tail sheath protein FI